MPHEKDEAIALAPTVPMALRGPMPVTSYASSSLPDDTGDLMTRVGMLYDKDPQLHTLWTEALQAKGLAGGANTKQDSAVSEVWRQSSWPAKTVRASR